jgi:nicotinamide mononucleotide transporter
LSHRAARDTARILGDVLSSFNSGVFTIARDHVTWAELLGFLTGVACVWLAAEQRMSNWPVGIANSIFFGLLFIDARLFADAALQVVYVALGFAGWLAWLQLRRPSSPRDIGRAGPGALLLTAAGVAAAAVALVPVLRAAHDSAPGLDSLTTALSLGAQALLCLKLLENWLWWIVADLIYVPLYTSRGLLLTAAVYVVFLVICVRAVPQWRATLAVQAPA